MEQNYEFTCGNCKTKSYLNNVSKEEMGKDMRVKCHKCKKVSIIRLEAPKNTAENLGKIFGWLVILFIICMIIPSFGFFNNCQERSIISRPFCVIGDMYINIFGDSNKQITNQEPSKIGDAKTSQAIQGSNDRIITSNYTNDVPSKENVMINNYQNISSINDRFNQEIFDNIQVKGEETSKAYNTCVSLIKDKSSKINEVRDQSTLYQFDGDVNDCLKEYLSNAKEFTQVIKDNPGQITQNSLINIQNRLISNSNYLKQISQQYSSASSQRHYYIHGVYQVNSLIQLGQIIGETGSAISSGDAVDTINSLQSLHDWWYYNGGVIDTGWNQ